MLFVSIDVGRPDVEGCTPLIKMLSFHCRFAAGMAVSYIKCQQFSWFDRRQHQLGLCSSLHGSRFNDGPRVHEGNSGIITDAIKLMGFSGQTSFCLLSHMQ